MAIIITNDGDRIVENIAERNAITAKFPGMNCTVKDAIGDPSTAGGYAKYEWMSDGANSRWILMELDEKITLNFASESHVITNGIVTADNIPLNDEIWTARVIDTISGVIIGDVKPTVLGAEIDLGTLDYDGQTLDFTYGYGSFTAQLSQVLNELTDKYAIIPAYNIDLKTGSVFSKTVIETTTFTVSGAAPAGEVSSFILELTNGGDFTVGWFAGVVWDGGAAPTLTAGGKDIIAFYTVDGGVNWSGLTVGLNMQAVV